MIAFGCAVSEADAYTGYAQPGIRLAAEPDSAIFPFAAEDPVARTYNLILDAAAQSQDLEALVLLHPHLEIVDVGFCGKVRGALEDPEVAIVGCAGARNVRSIAWWQGQVVRGNVTHRYNEFGGGEFPHLAWTEPLTPPAEVDAVDGFMLILSPWAVRKLRFDETLIHGHGLEVDLCLQARAGGRKVLVTDLQVVEHRSVELVEKVKVWVEGHIEVARKWDGRQPGLGEPTGDWRQRARRAEAEREAVRTEAYFRKLAVEDRLEALEREAALVLDSPSWRLTEPLRRVNHWRRERAAQNGRGPQNGRAPQDGRAVPSPRA